MGGHSEGMPSRQVAASSEGMASLHGARRRLGRLCTPRAANVLQHNSTRTASAVELRQITPDSMSMDVRRMCKTAHANGAQKGSVNGGSSIVAMMTLAQISLVLSMPHVRHAETIGERPTEPIWQREKRARLADAENKTC